jgi:hypothetical protein
MLAGIYAQRHAELVSATHYKSNPDAEFAPGNAWWRLSVWGAEINQHDVK